MNTYAFAKPITQLQPINQKLYTKDLTKVIQNHIIPLSSPSPSSSSSSSHDSGNQFQVISTSEQQNATLESTTTSQDGVNTYRITGQLYRTTVDQVFDLLWNLERSIALSGSLEAVDLLNEFETSEPLLIIADDDENAKNKNEEQAEKKHVIQVIYHAHKSPGFMISARDFLLIRTNVQLSDQRRCIATTSITHGSVGERPRFVRGHLHFSGYVLEGNKNDESVVNVTYVIKSDPRGSLPTWVLNMANNTLINKFVELQAHIDQMNK